MIAKAVRVEIMEDDENPDPTQKINTEDNPNHIE